MLPCAHVTWFYSYESRCEPQTDTEEGRTECAFNCFLGESGRLKVHFKSCAIKAPLSGFD